MKKRNLKKRMGIKKESYLPVEQWFEAPERYASLPLCNGEFTIIVDSTTGIVLYLVAKLKGVVRYTAYLDSVKFDEGFVKVSPEEIRQRSGKK